MASDEPIELRFFMGYGDSPLWGDGGPLSYEELSLSPDLQSALEAWEKVGWDAVSSDPPVYLEPEAGDDLAQRVSVELGEGFVVRTDTSVFRASAPAANRRAARRVSQRTVVARSHMARVREWIGNAEGHGGYIGFASMRSESDHQRALSDAVRAARGYRAISAIAEPSGQVTLYFAIDGDDRVFGLTVPLLGTAANLPWLKSEPASVDEWGAAVAVWLETTIRTGGIETAGINDRHGILFVEFTATE